MEAKKNPYFSEHVYEFIEKATRAAIQERKKLGLETNIIHEIGYSVFFGDYCEAFGLIDHHMNTAIDEVYAERLEQETGMNCQTLLDDFEHWYSKCMLEKEEDDAFAQYAYLVEAEALPDTFETVSKNEGYIEKCLEAFISSVRIVTKMLGKEEENPITD